MSNRTDSAEEPRQSLDLARLYELSQDVLCVVDDSGLFVRLSPAAEEVLGWPGGELLGRSLLDSVHDDDRAHTAAELDRLGDGAALVRFEHRFQTRAGAYVPVAWTLRADPDTGRRFGVARDLTGQRALQDRITALAHSDAAGSAKTEFLASMNHELRTPLNAILGYTELLTGDSNLTAKQQEALDAIRRSGEHLLMLISDILDFAKLDANKVTLNPREFLLSSFLRTITELFEGRAEQKNITFAHQQLTSLPEAICCDETRLRQVLVNLLSNAVKFTKAGGVILKTSHDGTRLRFQIEDTGIGIPPSHIEAIFRPFEQIPQDRSFVEGTGLGLSISSRLVRLMGGELHVASEVGKGSTFWFEIEPQLATNWQRPPRPVPTLVGYEGPRRKLLVVDDKAENRAVVSHMLRSAGFDIIEAKNGREAVDMAAAERPDLIVMDLVMPSLDGFEAIRRIRDITTLEAVPIVASSTSLVEGHNGRSEVGYDAFLQKPFKKETLFEILHQQLALTWRYELSHATPPVAPMQSAPPPVTAPPEPSLSKDQMQAIHDAAVIGDIREILVILEEAGVDGGDADARRDASLGAELYTLARGFQGKQIREKLKPYLE